MNKAAISDPLAEQFLSHINDQRVGLDNAVAVCDYCNGPIGSNDRLSIYVSDAELTGHCGPRSETGLFVHRVYCAGCDRKHIIYPNKGTNELLFDTTIGEDEGVADWSCEHSSDADHGESWCAKSAYEFVFGGFNEFAEAAHGHQHTISHEDIADMIRLAGIGFRQLFDEAGTIVAPEAKRDDIQQRAIKHLQILYRSGVPEVQNQKNLRRQLGGFSCIECDGEARHWDGISHTPSCSSSL